eukprot:jgi/Mesvir1/24907/Mv14013-RA.1
MSWLWRRSKDTKDAAAPIAAPEKAASAPAPGGLFQQTAALPDLELESIPTSSGTGAGISEGAGPRLYNPYHDIDARTVNKLYQYQLPEAPEFLFSEEAAVHRRGWGENISYYVGIGFLTGALAGGAYGGITGLRSKPELAVVDTTKLRVNRVLNEAGHTGRRLGNALGVLGLFYANFENVVSWLRDEDDILNSIVSGAGTGALYKMTAGPRTAAVAGITGGFAAAALTAGKHHVPLTLARHACNEAAGGGGEGAICLPPIPAMARQNLLSVLGQFSSIWTWEGVPRSNGAMWQVSDCMQRRPMLQPAIGLQDGMSYAIAMQIPWERYALEQKAGFNLVWRVLQFLSFVGFR